MVGFRCSVCRLIGLTYERINGESEEIRVPELSRFVVTLMHLVSPDTLYHVRIGLSDYSRELAYVDKLFPGYSTDIVTAWLCLQELLRLLNFNKTLRLPRKSLLALVFAWSVLRRYIAVPLNLPLSCANIWPLGKRPYRRTLLRFPLWCLDRPCRRADVDVWLQQYLAEHLDRTCNNRLLCAFRVFDAHSCMHKRLTDIECRLRERRQDRDGDCSNSAIDSILQNSFDRLIDLYVREVEYDLIKM